MPAEPVLSIVIDNYNYGRFLAEAIDSALAQDIDEVEVIVVDDGSTDHSRDVIASYGQRIHAVLKPNGGQASALNAGFAVSRGAFVLFLDADDRLTADAASGSLALMREGVSQIHCPLPLIDEAGRLTGQSMPRRPLQDGDVAQMFVEWGPYAVPVVSCSGNIWSRRFLSRVMPIPEAPYRLCADGYLLALGGLFGRIERRSPFAHYRIHGSNSHWRNQSGFEALTRDARVFEANAQALAHWAGQLGLLVRPELWVRRDWRYQLRRHLLWRSGRQDSGPTAIDVLAAVWLAQTRLPLKLALLSALAILLPLPCGLSCEPLCRIIAYHLGGPALFLPWLRRA